MLSYYLKSKGYSSQDFEGNCAQVYPQVLDLIELSRSAKTIMEIGFNAGHSAEAFLHTNPDCKVTSFDLGVHEYTKVGKEYIDAAFKNRHTLILGDSLETVPKFVEENPNTKFDILFIDGNHEYEYAKHDLLNCQKLAHTNSIVILDDTMFQEAFQAPFNIGPTKAWKESIEEGIIKEIFHVDYFAGRGMAWGTYII